MSGLSGLPALLTEDRVREVVREELAAHAELAHDRVQRGLGEPGAPGQLFEPVLQSDDADRQSCRERFDVLRELFEGCFTVILSDGAQGGEQIQNAVSRWHRFRDMVREGPDSVSGFVGGGDDHDASPSLVGDTGSVGDEAPAPGVGENRPGAGNAEAAS